MSYSVTVYKNSGFNIQNIPKNSTVLSSVASSQSFNNVDINQNRHLANIKIKATWSEICDADYCKVGDYYYFIIDCHMQNTNTAHLQLQLDGITTVGGVEAITILDGQTSRYSGVEVGDGDDPMLAPSNTMNISGAWTMQDAGGGATYVEMTLSPSKTADEKNATKFTYTDPVTGSELSAVIPDGKPTSADTMFFPETGVAGYSRGTTLYSFDNAMKTKIAKVTSLGLDKAMLNSVRLPSSCLDIRTTTDTAGDEYVNAIYGATQTANLPSAVPTNIASGRTNAAHINNSSFAKYGMLTCSGSKAEFIPADITPSDGITRKCDPSLEGKPFYRFSTYKGGADFWLNALPGMQWKTVPFLNNQRSGSDIQDLQTSMALESNAETYQRKKVIGSEGNTNVLAAAASMIGASIKKDINNRVDNSSIFGGLNINGTSSVSAYLGDYEYLQKQQEIVNKTINNRAYQVPSLNFPYNSEMLRDVKGNGVYVYRYTYTSADLDRIDKLITRYGKKYTAALTREMLIPPQNKNYVYVECSDVSVTHYNNNFQGSRWMNEVIAAQLRGGVRIWNVAPTNGTV